jgi:PAS domain S-box-containing protein
MSVWDDRRGRLSLGGLFFLLIGVAFALLIGLIGAQSNQLAALRTGLTEQVRTRAAAAAREAGEVLSARPDQPTATELANRLAVRRITLWDRDGGLLVDSMGDHPDGSRSLAEEVAPMTEVELARFSGAGLFGTPRRLATGAVLRTFWLPTIDSAHGAEPRLLAVTVELPPALGEQAAAGESWPFAVGIGTVLLLLAYAVAQWVRSFPRDEPLPQGGPVGSPGRRREAFMVGTFAGLIQELKEKEQELARLRSEAEERARHVETYNENILRSVASGVLTVDQELEITSYNEAAERILGRPCAQVIGRRPAELFGADHPLTRIIAQTLERQEWLSRQELELDGPNGRVWVGMSTSLLHDQAGAMLGATVVFTDLTEIKRLQEQVELRRRLAELGEVSAGIAHEFRNYMGTIMGYARLVAKSLKPDEPAAKMALAINEELKAMNRLIDDLLNFGRHTELAVAPTDLAGLLTRSVAQMAPRSAEQRVAVSVDLPSSDGSAGGSGRLPVILADEGLLYQALLNLYANALDAMPEGGALTVRARPIGSRDVEIVVTDTGVGIAPEHLDRIFLPMFTTKQKGTGLGLALAHKIILSHGGRIAVESREGGGTTFRLVLPVAPAAATVGGQRA